ncbi:MAG: hypothetical protein HKN08_11905 [Gammaproteobacteria bacterium]|nr:hypothetical protein [Gammaproteobacteria bacterium]
MLNRYVFNMMLALLGILSSPVTALSVADIELNSYLNQALDAKIALGDIESGDLDSINARIVDVNKGSAVSPGTLRIELVGEDSRHYLHVTSRESIREPILSFTIELTWGQGRLIREYDLLIDPAR